MEALRWGGIKGIDDKYKYAGSNNLDEVSWYNKNSNGRRHPVGQKKPNQLGLYDMSGNVWEWCADYWHENYKGAPDDGSAWIEEVRDSRRVVRGGSWGNGGNDCRPSVRSWYDTYVRGNFTGFRLARYHPPER